MKSAQAIENQKLIKASDLSDDRRALYQREQRIEDKQNFRSQLGKILGPEFIKLAEDLQKNGLEMFRDFVDPNVFGKFIEAYDEKMDEASRSALKYYFLNFQKHIDFLTNEEFKDAFFHPLIIALIAYEMGGPIRVVDVRGKNAEPERTMVRDNGAHVDDNPFNDEWKLLMTWLIEKNENNKIVSRNTGPQGQPFVSFPGTERLVRRLTTEFGANFKNPQELLGLLNHSDLNGKVYAIETKDERPNWALFEASHQVHHRKRTDDEPSRGCVIFAFHLVDPKSSPSAYTKKSNLPKSSTALDHFILAGDKDGLKTEEMNNYFLELMNSNAGLIKDKCTELMVNKQVIQAEEKMYSPEDLIKYFNLIIETYRTDYLESRSELRFQPENLIAPADKSAILNKLVRDAMEYDKHYDLDLIIYPDKREQIRKLPRMEIRERSIENVLNRDSTVKRLNELTIRVSNPEVLTASEFHYYNKENFIPHVTELLNNLATLLPPNFLSLLNSSENLNPKDFFGAYDELSPNIKKIAELYQLTKDLGEAFLHCDDIRALRAHAVFLYLVFDEVYELLKDNPAMQDKLNGINDIAQTVLQNYFNTVIIDDLTYKQTVQQLNIPEVALKQALANVLVKDANTGKISKFSDHPSYKMTTEKVSVSGLSIFDHSKETTTEQPVITSSQHKSNSSNQF